MTPTKLLDYCERIEGQGLAFVTLVIPRGKRKIRYGRRMRVFPHLLGQVMGSTETEGVIVSVAVTDVKRALIRILEQIERHAVLLAESGDHEQAAEWFGQYLQIRSRLA